MNAQNPASTTSRRSVAKGIAWAAPAVALGAAAPAAAASTPPVNCAANGVRSTTPPPNWQVSNPNANSSDVQVYWFVGGLQMYPTTAPTGIASWSLCPDVIKATTTLGRTITATGWSCNAIPSSWSVSSSPGLFFTLPGYTVAQNKGGERIASFEVDYYIKFYDTNGKLVGTTQGAGSTQCDYNTGAIAANQTSSPTTSSSWTPGTFATPL